MKFTELPLKSACVIDSEPFEDKRGLFERIFCEKEFKEISHSKKIVQINHSFTKEKGTLRGMHYQEPPMTEIKMVKCLRGSVYDVIIDLRKGSDTFLKWFGETLSSDNRRMMYVPEGFAHGFQCLTNDVHMIYFHSKKYNNSFENGLNPLDPVLSIKWPLKIRNLSFKDQNFISLKENFIGL